MTKINYVEKRVLLSFGLSIIFLVFLIMFHSKITLIYNLESHLGFHTVLECVSIFVSFSIFTFGWKTFPFTQSRKLIFLASAFLIVGVMDFLHMITYEGMPKFLFESSIQKSIWFSMLSRITEMITVFILLFRKDKRVSSDINYKYLATTLLLIMVLVSLSLILSSYYPNLFITADGSTLFKKSLQLTLAFLHLSLFFYVINVYKQNKSELYIYLALALWFASISAITFTQFHNFYGIGNLIGHTFKAIGYMYVMKAFYFSVMDDAKQAEQNAIKAERELSHIMRQQRGMVFKVIKENNDYIHTLCDGELVHELGFQPEIIRGKKIKDIVGNEENIRGITYFYNKAWQTGEKTTFEVTVQDKQLFTSLNPILENGKVTEIIGNITDITELKTMQEMLRNTEKLSLVGELSAGFAHEIKNPITTLKGFLQMMNADADGKNKSVIELMLTEIQRVEEVTKDFMNLARPFPVNFQRNNVTQILEEVISFMNPTARLSGVEIKFEYDERVNELFCEGNQLRQVFINLIKNAIEAMPEGGRMTISIRKNENQQVTLIFEDEGIGIPEDKLQNIGEAFYTSKEKGNGLGLMMSKKIIDQHQGTINIKSEIGKGTTFIIELPLLLLENRIALSI